MSRDQQHIEKKGFFQKLEDWLEYLLGDDEQEPTLSQNAQNYIEESHFIQLTSLWDREKIERQQITERQQLALATNFLKPTTLAQSEETSMPRHRNHHYRQRQRHKSTMAARVMQDTMANLADDEMASAARHAAYANARHEDSEDSSSYLQMRRTQKEESARAQIQTQIRDLEHEAFFDRDELIEQEDCAREKIYGTELLGKIQIEDREDLQFAEHYQRNLETDHEVNARYDINIQSLIDRSDAKKRETARLSKEIEQGEANARAKIDANFTSQRTQFFRREKKERTNTNDFVAVSKKLNKTSGAKFMSSADFVVVNKKPNVIKKSFFSTPTPQPEAKHDDPAPKSQGWAEYFASFLPGGK